VSVAQRRVLQAKLGLAVALAEEFLDAARCPLVVDAPSLGGMGDVAGVEQQAQNLALVEAKWCGWGRERGECVVDVSLL